MSWPRVVRYPIPDAVCSCGAPVESSCRALMAPGHRCPMGVCRMCGRTWRRIPTLPLVHENAGSRDSGTYPSTIPLRALYPGAP